MASTYTSEFDGATIDARLKPATATKLGTVMAKAKTTETEEVAVDSDGKLFVAVGGGSYTLTAATATALGGIKADAKTASETVEVKIGTDSKLYVPAGGGSYTLPQANGTALGGIKADAKTASDTQEVKIDASTGKLYVAPTTGETYTLPTAATDTKGGIKIGDDFTMSGEVLTINAITNAKIDEICV